MLLTKTEVKSITTYDPDKIKIGDVISYVDKPSWASFKKYRFYGIVYRIEPTNLYIKVSHLSPSAEQTVMDGRISVEDSHIIEYVLRNGVVPN